MKKVYQTEDGKVFDTLAAAEDHEKAQMQEWLNTSMVGTWIKEVLATMTGEAENYYCTERYMGLRFRDAAYALAQEKAAKYGSRSPLEVISALFNEEDEDLDLEDDDDGSFIRSEN